MNLGKLAVLPSLPDAIRRLEELAYNLWWSWETEAQALFSRLDPDRWEQVNHNPVKLLHHVEQSKLDAAAANSDFLHAYRQVLSAFDAYMHSDAETWYRAHHGAHDDAQAGQVIAYFSAEFGLHEALPIYSGGLGILSGDHCKAASDLGLPFIGMGFLYPQGYFTQRIDADGEQQAEYERIDFNEVPVRPALNRDGSELLISVDLPGRTVYAKVWRIQVGRIPVYLMDTDVSRNAPQDRELSARLYGGDREMRISQEIVLGIGGVRAVYALGYDPGVWHMNEGHSAFLGLERARLLVQNQNLSFEEAVEVVRADTLFTTHTPVPAGNDSFTFELVDKFFWQYWGQLGIDREQFVEFARQELTWGAQYSMTVLALRLSAYHNGVSQLHGHVSRTMWKFLWPDTPVDEVPIGAITNGVHTKTWLVHELKALYNEYLPTGWRERVEEPATWNAVAEIPDAELWAVHQKRKEKLVRFVRQRARIQMLRHGEGPQRVDMAEQLLDSNALTIGFARRFATYKRASLLFHDIERLKRILNDPQRPVQIIFSGKAHPADDAGKAMIQQVYAMSQDPDFFGKIIFIENYDMNVARHLISGVDLWINTPRRPREASGTSGQKAALSGIPNFSILDGWWAEGYNGENGWAIGEEREYKDQETQDEADVYSLYTVLEETIIPTYYARAEGSNLPVNWIRIMKNAIRSCAPHFSMRRMVIDYTNRYYLAAADSGRAYHAQGFALAKQMEAWKAALHDRWNDVRVERGELPVTTVKVGEHVPLQAKVWLNGISSDDVIVEAVVGEQTTNGELHTPTVYPMQQNGVQDGALLYETEFSPETTGVLAVGVRVRPQHENLIQNMEPGLIRWA